MYFKLILDHARALTNPKYIGEPELCSRSDAMTSDRQGTATAN